MHRLRKNTRAKTDVSTLFFFFFFGRLFPLLSRALTASRSAGSSFLHSPGSFQPLFDFLRASQPDEALPLRACVEHGFKVSLVAPVAREQPSEDGLSRAKRHRKRLVVAVADGQVVAAPSERPLEQLQERLSKPEVDPNDGVCSLPHSAHVPVVPGRRPGCCAASGGVDERRSLRPRSLLPVRVVSETDVVQLDERAVEDAGDLASQSGLARACSADHRYSLDRPSHVA